MNIKEAKQQIKNAMTVYFTKDAFGNYVIPPERQRPVFLLGAPGIGKTAIMEQVAAELDVGLVSYSMTHHTRQSALGLPFIENKIYGGKEYRISEYTMSEIIASVYDTIEESGKKEGILFLDEINCVSETLAPAMLQFLQYKVFGRHRVPEGWLVVTAGNPPEYNNSVREFDLVTWDRLKRIDVEPEFSVWKEYAYKKGIHASIMTYLEIKQGDFYKIETTVDGKSFVTARGWTDLSEMIHLYEQHHIPVDAKLIGQYVQNPQITKSFAMYYDLFNKYKSDYQVDSILSGKADAEIKERARNGKFDERLALLGMLLDAVSIDLRKVHDMENAQKELMNVLKNVRFSLQMASKEPADVLDEQIKNIYKTIENGKKSMSLSPEKHHAYLQTVESLTEMKKLLKEHPTSGTEAFALMKKTFDEKTKQIKAYADKTKKKLSYMFVFCEEVFSDGQELLILVTELTINFYGAHFISRYGCEEYFRHNKSLLFHDRQKEIMAEVEKLNLDEEED